MPARGTKKPAPEPSPEEHEGHEEHEEAGEFLNRAARRAQGKKGQAPKAVGKITPGHRAAVQSTRQWANRRSG